MDEMMFFHNPDDPHGFLSNWYASEFEVDGVSFSSLEQYMMYKKALTFSDDASARAIMSTDDPAEIKRLGRKVKPFNSVMWSGRSQIVVYNGLIAKFGQGEQLRKKLIATKDALLVECSNDDTIWAIGLALNDPRRFGINLWRGKNLLGFALMETRQRLKKM